MSRLTPEDEEVLGVTAFTGALIAAAALVVAGLALPALLLLLAAVALVPWLVRQLRREDLCQGLDDELIGLGVHVETNGPHGAEAGVLRRGGARPAADRAGTRDAHVRVVQPVHAVCKKRAAEP